MLNSADSQWLGPVSGPDTIDENTLMLLPKSFSMYKSA